MMNRIEQLCKFAFHFSNMDTVFANPMSNTLLEYGLTEIPESLKPYFSDFICSLHLNESNNEYKVIFHLNSYGLNFISAKVYDGTYLGSIVVGPFLLKEPTLQMVESVLLENKLAISLKDIVMQYYLTLPLLSSFKAQITAEFLSYIVSTFHQGCFETQQIGNLTYDFKPEYSIPPEIIKQNTDNVIETLEKRYYVENKMLHAVETGNGELFESIVKKSTSFNYTMSDRIPNDPLRSYKNYCIVLNTLLRKAAEKGGLHPIYLDSISTKYAVQIEKCISVQKLSNLYNTMQKEYCNAVKKFSLKKYSPSIRKAVEYIRVNLNQNLSLSSISTTLHLSPAELSRQFKKETGESITDYINKIRTKEALYILENENLSITDISFMTGFNDVNYFTKVFKKLNGITPSEYRRKK